MIVSIDRELWSLQWLIGCSPISYENRHWFTSAKCFLTAKVGSQLLTGFLFPLVVVTVSGIISVVCCDSWVLNDTLTNSQEWPAGSPYAPGKRPFQTTGSVATRREGLEVSRGGGKAFCRTTPGTNQPWFLLVNHQPCDEILWRFWTSWNHSFSLDTVEWTISIYEVLYGCWCKIVSPPTGESCMIVDHELDVQVIDLDPTRFILDNDRKNGQ